SKNDQHNIENFLTNLEHLQHPPPQFLSLITITPPNQKTKTFKPTLSPVITTQPHPNNPFPYHPIFFLPQLNKTIPQITNDQNPKITHRPNPIPLLK
ncbi:non-canonical purine NTP pyrophosphatase, partial [Staphylococcus epidermidis]|uniref:non-canonical purine NTP pyrophosphatase n=1 Tax=Staphylococcus epidermidis TaxID=1282 RepID=UPI0037DA63CD